MIIKLAIVLTLFSVSGIAQAQTDAKARIIVCKRFSKGLGGAKPIYCDGEKVAGLRSKDTYFVLEVPPGEHSFRSVAKLGEFMIDCSPGQTYFLEIVLQGMFFKLMQKSPPEGESILQMIRNGDMRPIEAKDIIDRSKVSLTLAK